MKKLSKKQRNAIYKEALSEFLESRDGNKYLCMIIGRLVGTWPSGSDKELLVLMPELKLMLRRDVSGDYVAWATSTQDNNDVNIIREIIIYFLIEMTNAK